jgi:hypothetical protein
MRTEFSITITVTADRWDNYSGAESSENEKSSRAATVLVALNKASNTDYSIPLLHFRQWIGDAARAVIYLIAISSRANHPLPRLVRASPLIGL